MSSEYWIDKRAPWVSSALSSIYRRSSHRRKSYAMVWMFRSAIPVGLRGGNFHVQMTSAEPAFPRVEEGGGSRHPVSNWVCPSFPTITSLTFTLRPKWLYGLGFLALRLSIPHWFSACTYFSRSFLFCQQKNKLFMATTSVVILAVFSQRIEMILKKRLKE